MAFALFILNLYWYTIVVTKIMQTTGLMKLSEEQLKKLDAADNNAEGKGKVAPEKKDD